MEKLITICLCFVVSIASAQTFTLKSAELGGQATNRQVYKGFGCAGENQSPQLSWENAPAGTQSFALTIHDADAPTGSGWWHWVVFDIPRNIVELKAGASDPSKGFMPGGAIQSLTDFGSYGYGGPCPPAGDQSHAYTVTLYALDTDNLGLQQDANPALVGFNLSAHTIKKASIVFYYKRE